MIHAPPRLSIFAGASPARTTQTKRSGPVQLRSAAARCERYEHGPLPACVKIPFDIVDPSP
jgi:hypothetical protein